MVRTPASSPPAAAGGHGGRIRRRLTCTGVVQGVGFRPAVYRLASELDLAGFVRNDDRGATIEVEGPAAAVTAFEEGLPLAAPCLAKLERIERHELMPSGATGFRVAATRGERRGDALTPPDAALCAACRREVDDPADRRNRYPFTNCTDCGPRFSVIRALPYDRSRTSMACFALCADCAAEYADPADRRFHAEPLACPRCGPKLWMAGADGEELAAGAEALAATRAALAAGEIVAIKGIGGFQLACRADRDGPVARLRQRKARPSRPLAVMVDSLAVARSLVHLGPEDERLLASAAAPILLAPARQPTPVSGLVAPGVVDLGVMLPTSPLHHELFRDADYRVLVMTSGNARDEPICTGNREAFARLAGLADRFLLHDRDVVRRVDDSVVRAMPCGDYCVVRRSRGYVPSALPLPERLEVPILALGGHLQVTACAATGRSAYPSQHVGDLDSDPARAFLREVAGGLEAFLDTRAELLVTDLHPDYASTWLGAELARDRGGRHLQVQHHLAHLAAVLGERGRFPAAGERAAGIVLDGTGFGTDGTAWGCEWLVLDGELTWRRAGHGSELVLVGGEAAVRQPWRIAAAALAQAGAEELLDRTPLARQVSPDALRAVAGLASKGWPRACGAGRLFEAAGALLGLCPENRYEGEAAVRLETAASAVGLGDDWQEITLAEEPVLPQIALLEAAAGRLARGQSVGRVAAGLIRTFCRLAAELTCRVLPPGLRAVALAGGCFVNRLLVGQLRADLHHFGIDAFWPGELPPGDGGLAYGQAVLAAASEARGRTLRQLSPTRQTAAPPR